MKTITPSIKLMKMLASVKGEMWAIRPDKIELFAMACLDASDQLKEGMTIGMQDLFDLRQPMTIDQNGIAHIQIKESLVNKYPKIYEKLGMVTLYGTIKDEIKEAIDTGAKAIMFSIDSPGGTVSGCVECADVIANISIPTLGYCEGLACSAAYKLASGMDQIIASQSAQVGNIGSVMSWADCSEFWANLGIEMKALTSEGASLKSTFHTEPNEEQIVFLQESINASGEAFRNHVSSNRLAKSGVVMAEEVWKAGWYSGEKAGDLGLIDGIGTKESAYEYLLSMI